MQTTVEMNSSVKDISSIVEYISNRSEELKLHSRADHYSHCLWKANLYVLQIRAICSISHTRIDYAKTY